MLKKLIKKFISSNIGQGILVYLCTAYIRFVYFTSRWQYVREDIIDGCVKNKKPFIICFWHGRLAMLTCAWQRREPFQILLSEHRDGKFIAHIAKQFGIDAVYGSTTRSGAKAMFELIKSVRAGVTIGITPDGPRGPAYKVSRGVIVLSRLVQADIIPVSYSASRSKTLRTWDRFLLPLPFSKGAFVIGPPISYPKEKEDEENCQKAVEKSLNTITREADQLVRA